MIQLKCIKTLTRFLWNTVTVLPYSNIIVDGTAGRRLFSILLIGMRSPQQLVESHHPQQSSISSNNISDMMKVSSSKYVGFGWKYNDHAYWKVQMMKRAYHTTNIYDDIKLRVEHDRTDKQHRYVPMIFWILYFLTHSMNSIKSIFPW